MWNHIGKRGYTFFLEERNGIEVIELRDIEDGGKSECRCHPRKHTRRSEIFGRFRRKKSSMKIVVIFIAVVLLLAVVYVGLKKIIVAKEDILSGCSQKTYTTNTDDRKDVGNDDDAGIHIGCTNDPKSNKKSSHIDQQHTLNATEVGTVPITLEKNIIGKKDKDYNYIDDNVDIVGKSAPDTHDFDFDIDFDIDIYYKNENNDANFSDHVPVSTDVNDSENNEYILGEALEVTQQQDTLPQVEMAVINAPIESEEIVVLYPNENLHPEQFRYSPNGRFKFGLTENDGNLVLMQVDSSAEAVIWSVRADLGSNWVSPLKPQCFMQSDGNLVLRDTQRKESIWTTKTHGNLQARLVLDNSGRVAVRSGNEQRTVLWMDGLQSNQYNGPSSENMKFPIRGAFYYPWYPSTWHVDGHRAHYDTLLGMYSSSDPEVAHAHVEDMDYGQIQLSIASWWGPGTNLDRARLAMLMDETVAQNSPLKWTIYHEDEHGNDPAPEKLHKDLDYLKKWFAWHKAWAHIDGKPVIFVYNESGCEVASRWLQASRGEWYVVLKLFPGFEVCPDQPESWHQYGVGKIDGMVHNPGHSFVLSPGFWRADTDIPYLKRLSRTQFCQNTKKMVESDEPWQLIVSFNEAGEGTLIEPSPEWESSSGFGYYLDCLHES